MVSGLSLKLPSWSMARANSAGKSPNAFSAVARAVLVRDGDIELNLREVHDQDSQPLFLNGLAVERERDLRGGGEGIRERGGKVRHGAEQAF